GGMDSPVKIDMGGEAMDLEWMCGGPMRDVLRQYGTIGVADVQLRFAGYYQNDDTGDGDAIEIIVRGRHEEIDMGEQKPGDGGDFKVKTTIAYYKLTWNGVTEIEIDALGMVLIVGGVDRLAQQRAALGIF
ncbi:MAG: phage major tail tube protein, partial [Sphingomonas sp.]